METQQWLEENYPDKKTFQIHINQQLEGVLDCSGYDNLWKISISYQVDTSKFEITSASYKDWQEKTQETEIFHCIPAQEWLDENYPQNGTCIRKWSGGEEHEDYNKTRTQITELKIWNQNLEGQLDLSDFPNLKELNCEDNKLTSLNVSNCDKLNWLECYNNHLTQIPHLPNPEQLTELFISDNNFPPQDLSIFSQLRNLEDLRIDYNPFYGSLEPLKDLTKLEELYISNTKISGSLEYLKDLNNLQTLRISNTDLNSGVEYLPNSLEDISYNTQDRPNCKLSQIKNQLDQKYWVDIHWGFIGVFKMHKNSWLDQGFTKEQTKEWIVAGAEPDSAKFINWFLNFKKLDLAWALENEEEFRDLRDKYKNFGTCKECQQPNTSGGREYGEGWCQSCNAKHFQQDFDKWTSGNPNIDAFIHKCQLEATSTWNLLEWIPYEQFNNIEHVAKGGFGKVEKAEWMGGSISYWNSEEKNWERSKDDYNRKNYQTVALKTLTNSQNINTEFLPELTLYKMFHSSVSNMVPCYGISQDKEGNYIMVMKYMEKGNLREHLRENYQELDFKDKLNFLQQISQGLKDIHRKKLIHQDFHSGNVVVNNENIFYEDGHEKINKCHITDLGLCKPVNETDNSKVYGVMPYVAPEVLLNKPYTQASDVYSFGMITYEILTGSPPFANQAHGLGLSLKICQGERPQFPPQVKYPQELVDLIKRCWDGEPNNRPTIGEISQIINNWFNEEGWKSLKEDTILYQQIQEAEEYNKTLSQEIKYPAYQTKETVWHSKPINTKQITQLLQQKTEEYHTKALEELTLDNINLDELNLQEDPQEQSSQQAQIQIPPQGNN